MTLKYESELLFDLMKRDGDDTPSDVLPYESELKEKYLNQVTGAYPKLQDYRAEWLNYNLHYRLPSDFPAESVTNVTSAIFYNVVPYEYNSAILKGSTKYRDIDTGDILDTFDESKNLELVSVKMPVLTTSNEDGTKTNILTAPEEVVLRSLPNGVCDTLNVESGEYVQKIGETFFDGSDDEGWVFHGLEGSGKYCYKTKYIAGVTVGDSDGYCDKLKYVNGTQYPWGKKYNCISILNSKWLTTYTEHETLDLYKQWLSQNPITVQYQLATPVIKTVELSCINEQGESTSFRPIEGTMHVSTSSQTLPPLLDMSDPVEAITQNLMSFANIEVEE